MPREHLIQYNYPEIINYSEEMYSYSHFQITTWVSRDLQPNAWL